MLNRVVFHIIDIINPQIQAHSSDDLLTVAESSSHTKYVASPKWKAGELLLLKAFSQVLKMNREMHE